MMLCTVIMATITAVMMSVMITVCVRIIFQRSGGKGLCRFVRRSLNTGIQPDSGIGQRYLSTHADTAADQGIHSGCLQEACQGTVAAAVCIHNLFTNDLSILNII